MPGDLLTAAAIAKTLNLPESTIRHYVRRYALWIPSIGEGRNRRLSPDALEVVRFIAELHRGGASGEMVEAALARRYPTTANNEQPATTDRLAMTTTDDNRALLAHVLNEALRTQAAELENVIQAHVGDLHRRIADLQRQVEELTQRLDEQQRPLTTSQQDPQPPAAPQLEASEPPADVDQVRQPTPARPSRWDRFRAWLAGE